MQPKYQINLFLSEAEKDLTEKMKKEQDLSHHDIYVVGLKKLEQVIQPEKPADTKKT